MTNYLHSFLLPCIALLAACSLQEPVSPEAPARETRTSTIPGRAVVYLTEEAADHFSTDEFPEVSASLGILEAERVFPEAGEFEARHRAAGLHRWYRIRYDNTVPATKAQEDLSALPGVESVSFPIRKVRRGYFNDPYLDEDQWNLRNDRTGARFKKGMDINVEPVWREFTAGSEEVIVAVIDGGIEMNHPDLEGVVLKPTSSGGSRNFVAGYSPTMIYGDSHGTHVGGIIGAISNNGVGISGIAGGYDGKGGVRLMSCVIFGGTEEEPEGGDGTEDAEAMVWAADHGAVIANNSWGFAAESEEQAGIWARSFEEETDVEKQSPTRVAIDYFIEHAGVDVHGRQTGPMRGGVVFFASGNDGWAHDSPSEYEAVIAVGAFGPDGKMAQYSNYGPWVDILAPGGSDGKKNYSEWILSPALDGYYYMSGTSMACPHASGVAALLVSYYGGEGFTNEKLKEMLLGGAVEDIIDKQGRFCGGGKLDAYGAFTYKQGGEDQPKISFSTDYDGDWRIKAHESLNVSFRIKGNEGSRLPVTFESNCPGASGRCATSQVAILINALQAEPGDYTAVIRVGRVAQQRVNFTILENHSPVLVKSIDNLIFNAASSTLVTLDLNEYFSDPDGEDPVFRTTLSAEDVLSIRLSEGKLVFGPQGYGQVRVDVVAEDARGASCSTFFQVLARNTTLDLDIYPNPVSDILYIRPGEDSETSVSLFNRSGAKVRSASRGAGPFSPIGLDVKALDPGTYTLEVSYGGKQKVSNIVKY